MALIGHNLIYKGEVEGYYHFVSTEGVVHNYKIETVLGPSILEIGKKFIVEKVTPTAFMVKPA